MVKELEVAAANTENALSAAKAAQIFTLIKENQLVTALCLFCLWQTGALLSAASYVQGGVC